MGCGRHWGWPWFLFWWECPRFCLCERAGELVIDGLDHHLTNPCQPAAKPLRPRPHTVAFGRADHPPAIVLRPSRMIGCSLKALVHHGGALGWCFCPTPLRLRAVAERTQRLGQVRLLRAGQAKSPRPRSRLSCLGLPRDLVAPLRAARWGGRTGRVWADGSASAGYIFSPRRTASPYGLRPGAPLQSGQIESKCRPLPRSTGHCDGLPMIML